MGAWKRSHGIVLLLVVVTLVAVGRLCGGEFTWWDDRLTLFQNPLMNPPTWKTVGYYWTHAYMQIYTPVTFMAWAGLAAVAQVGTADERGIALNPYVFHIANVLLHVGNVLLVYAIVRRVVGKEWAAAAGAMIFGVHPVQVETVGWVSGMKDLLCASFVLGAVWCYVASVQKGSRRLYWLGLALMVLGMLSKPTAVMTPVLLAGLDRWGLGRPWRAVAASLWPWCVAMVPCLVWTKLVQYIPQIAPVWARPLIALDALAFYLGKLVWPATLVVDYQHNPARVMARQWWWATGVVPVVVALALWAGRRRRPVLVAAGWVFVVGVGPILGFTSFMFQDYSTVADHYLYIPMLGVALAAAWACARWPGKGTAWAVGVVVAVLAVRSAVQAGVWMDNVSLFGHALAVYPDSYVGHAHMASECEVRASTDKANAPALMDAAERHQRATVQARPDRMNPWYSLGMLMIKRGKPDEAIEPLRNAIARFEPPFDEPVDLGRAHQALGALLWRMGEREEAMGHFESAVRYAPEVPEFAQTLAGARREFRHATTTRAATTTSAQ